MLTSSVQSCVRPFCEASCNGVKPHLSMAFTHVLNLISNEAISTCYTTAKQHIAGSVVITRAGNNDKNLLANFGKLNCKL